MKEIFGQIGRDRLKKRPGEFNPLLLAYLGDAVYEMFIRYHLLAKGQNRPNDIHSEAVQFVSATAQAEALRQVQAKLTEEEKDVIRRGRNAKSGSVPKNAKIVDYRYSTGLEALIGHWYLKGDTDRLTEVMKQIIEKLEGDRENGK